MQTVTVDYASWRREAEAVEEMKNIIACLLTSYEGSYGNVADALGRRAVALVPDWRERAENFDPTDSS